MKKQLKVGNIGWPCKHLTSERMIFRLNLLKEIHTQETFQLQKVLNKDIALVGQRTVPPASLGLQRKIAWSTGKIALMLL